MLSLSDNLKIYNLNYLISFAKFISSTEPNQYVSYASNFVSVPIVIVVVEVVVMVMALILVVVKVKMVMVVVVVVEIILYLRFHVLL